MTRPRKDARCPAQAQRPEGLIHCQRREGHTGAHSCGPIRWPAS